MPRKEYIDQIVAQMPGAQYIEPAGASESLQTIQACAARGGESIVLLKARTDTAYFQTALTVASAICFIRGRVRYPGQKSASPMPSALVYFGQQVEQFKALTQPIANGYAQAS